MNLIRLTPWALSIAYVLAVIALPAIANFGYCDGSRLENLCQIVPTQKLVEFDKWGSYLSGALVPLSLLWVGMAFRLQQHQLAEQGRHQADAAKIAYETQKITDRQTLTSMASTYVHRMEVALQNLAGLIDSNAPRKAKGKYGPILNHKGPITNEDLGFVFTNLHNLLIDINRGEIAEDDVQETKALFVDTDMSDCLRFFFEIYNEFYRRCQALECIVLMPPYIVSMVDGLKYSVLRSTCRWHPDEHERNRLKYLVGWTDADLERQYLDRPEDSLLEPFDIEEYYRKLNNRHSRHKQDVY